MCEGNQPQQAGLESLPLRITSMAGLGPTLTRLPLGVLHVAALLRTVGFDLRFQPAPCHKVAQRHHMVLHCEAQGLQRLAQIAC